MQLTYFGVPHSFMAQALESGETDISLCVKSRILNLKSLKGCRTKFAVPYCTIRYSP